MRSRLFNSGRSSRNMSAIVLLMPIPVHPALVAEHWERCDGGRGDNAVGSLRKLADQHHEQILVAQQSRAQARSAVGLHRSIPLGGQVPVGRHGISGPHGMVRSALPTLTPRLRWSSSARRLREGSCEARPRSRRPWRSLDRRVRRSRIAARPGGRRVHVVDQPVLSVYVAAVLPPMTGG